MCCNPNHPKQGRGQCHGNFANNPLLWSKKKKKEMLEDYREGLRKQLEDVEEAIKEMEEEG